MTNTKQKKTVLDLSAPFCEWQVLLFMLWLASRFLLTQHGPTHDINLLTQIAAQVTIVWLVMPTTAETPMGCHACSAFPAPDQTSATRKRISHAIHSFFASV